MSRSKLHVLTVAGARPNFMKIAPIIRSFQKYNAIISTLVHTGHHYDHGLSTVFFKELGIRQPKINLKVGSGTHAKQTARIMSLFEDVLIKQKPNLVLVVGDVNSTMACTLVAKKMGMGGAQV